MFKVKDNSLDLEMYQGDYGEQLPIDIIDGEIVEGDILRFIIKDANLTEIINKVMEIEENSFVFSLTEQETALLPAGNYFWSLKQYRDNTLIDTLTGRNEFNVVRG